MKHIMLAALVLLAIAGPKLAMASSADRSEYWLNVCKGEKPEPQCFGFVIGYYSGWQMAESIALHEYKIKNWDKGRKKLRGCPPKGVTMTQEVKIWVKHLTSHPEDLHMKPSMTFSIAQSVAFPCKQ